MGSTSRVSPAEIQQGAEMHRGTVHAALQAYLDANGFSVEAYTAPTFEIPVFGRPRKFPNSPQRQWAIPLHDLHHVATGYSTDFVGEAEIGAWELGAGCRTFIVYTLNIIAVTLGLFLAPVRVVRAFRHGLRARTLYRVELQYVDCLTLDVSALRARLGVPAEGLGKVRWGVATELPHKPELGISRHGGSQKSHS